MPVSYNKLVFVFIWFMVAVMPWVEAQLFLKRTPATTRPKFSKRVAVITLVVSGVTLIVGGWLISLIDRVSQSQQTLLWTCTTILVPFHIGVLIQSLFYWQIKDWYESHVLDH